MAEAVRENRHEVNGREAPAVADVVQRRGLRGFDPPLHREVGEGLRDIARVTHTGRLQSVAAVVAWTPVSWAKRPQEIDLLTFAVEGLEDEWDVLDAMAEALGPIVGELPFSPVVKPVSAEQWRQAVEREGPGWRHVARRGVLLYDAASKKQLA